MDSFEQLFGSWPKWHLGAILAQEPKVALIHVSARRAQYCTAPADNAANLLGFQQAIARLGKTGYGFVSTGWVAGGLPF